jgi:IMP dehydrogenase
MINRRGLTFDDVLMVPSYCGLRTRRAANTSVAVGTMTFDIPIVSANMDTITGPEMAFTMARLGGLGILHRFMSIEENVEAFKAVDLKIDASGWVGVSVGVNDEELRRASALIAAGADIICVDVAHGHAKMVGKMIKHLKDRMRSGIVIAGNVATYAGADYLASCGADVIKVGIGPGSVCTTRIKTGFGVPQLTAIMDCARGSKPIIADGGIRTPGDVVKALAAGASMVMLGGMLAGTLETPGDIIHPEGSGPVGPVKSFRGMASKEAQDDFMGGMGDWKTAEGVATTVPARGSVEEVIRDVLGGLRSGMTYAGVSDLAELRRRVEFIEVSPSAMIEGTPHVLQR